MQLLKLLLDVSVIVKKFLRRSSCFLFCCFFSFSFSMLLALNPHCLVQNHFDAVGIMLHVHVPHITLFFEVQCIHCIIKMSERLKQIKEVHVE